MSGPRLLRSVVAELEKRLGRAITYEDPVRIDPSDFSAVTRNGRSGLKLRENTFSFDFERPAVTGDAPINGILHRVVAQYNQSATDGEYRVDKTGVVFHVLPARVKGAHGTLESFRGVLDTRISVLSGARTGVEQLSEIRTALRNGGHPGFGLGVVPFAALQGSMSGAVANEPARDAIMRILGSSPFVLSWELLCDPGLNPTCLLNIHPVKQ